MKRSYTGCEALSKKGTEKDVRGIRTVKTRKSLYLYKQRILQRQGKGMEEKESVIAQASSKLCELKQQEESTGPPSLKTVG